MWRRAHGRPPWWPEGEPWPPAGPPWQRWGNGPPPFIRRLGCLFFALFAFTVVGIVATPWILLLGLGIVRPGGGPPPLFFAGVVIVVVVMVVAAGSAVRSFRRVAGPLGDVMVAAQRVEAGDYRVRVPEPYRGPAELLGLVRAMNTMIARLEDDERRRRELLADVGHELRTPLAVIQGEVEAMLDGVHTPDAARLGTLLDEVHVLSRLVDDLRTLTLAEAGTLALHPEPTDMTELLADVGENFTAAAEKAGVTVQVDAPEDLPLLDIDPVRLREVLSNLVANALRHTPEGGSVTLAASLDGESTRITVADTGSGIAPELLPHVFDRFVKGPGSRGSGLGLAIARNLVLASGGQISVDSAPGAGTTMTVKLPVGRAQ